jgi:dipeptidyl aminopeptidase/acylaminoacyl peptidase
MQKPLYFENDDCLIAGTLHVPNGEGPWPGVIFCHGFTGSRLESHFLFVAASRALAERGIASLRFDFRGSGESEGEFVEMTPSAEISDARRAFHVLAQQPEVDASHMGIVGLSLGGLVAACTAGVEHRARSVVLWAAVADMARVVNASSTPENEREFASQGWTDLAGHKLGRAFIQDMATHDPVSRIAEADSALLIIHGSDDQSVNVEDAETFYSKAQRPGREVAKLIIEGADHTFNRVSWTETVIRATADWLEKTL